MKTEKAFLNGMWHRIEMLERKELERERAKAINRKLTIRTIYISISTVIAFITIALFNKYIGELIYPITFGLLAIAFYIEISFMKEKGDGKYAN